MSYQQVKGAFSLPIKCFHMPPGSAPKSWDVPTQILGYPGHSRSKTTEKGTFWAAANGGVTNGGLRGVWPHFLEIGQNRPFSPFFCLFRPFPEGAKSTWEIQKTEDKGLFPQISSDCIKPPSLKPPFAALQTLHEVFVQDIPGPGCAKSILPQN